VTPKWNEVETLAFGKSEGFVEVFAIFAKKSIFEKYTLIFFSKIRVFQKKTKSRQNHTLKCDFVGVPQMASI